MARISKININSVPYDLKDAKVNTFLLNWIKKIFGDSITELPETIADDKLLKSAATKEYTDLTSDTPTTDTANKLVTAWSVKKYLDDKIAPGLKENKIYTTLPTASADTIGILGLVKNTEASAGEYIEYITVKNDDGTYSWEQIGTTKTEVTGVLEVDKANIAGVKFSSTDQTISAAALSAETALDLKELSHKAATDLEVEFAEKTLATAQTCGKTTVTPSGSIDLTSVKPKQDVANTFKYSSYTPEGDIKANSEAAKTWSIAYTDSTETLSLTSYALTFEGTEAEDVIADGFGTGFTWDTYDKDALFTGDAEEFDVELTKIPELKNGTVKIK